MKHKRTIGLLTLVIIFASVVAGIVGIFSTGGQGEFEFNAITNKSVAIYGKGIYHNDSVSIATQAIAQDFITLVLGIPLLISSYFSAIKNSLKGMLLLLGTLGYFLYTYTSYSFLSMYNEFFLLYVFIMSCSFFAFITLSMSIDINALPKYFNATFKRKFVAGFMVCFSILIFLMWVGRIVPSLLDDIDPIGLEHYSTLVIQALDLGFVVPISCLGGILLWMKKPFGYFIATIVLVKGITLASAVTMMAVNQYIHGIAVSLGELMIFPTLNLLFLYSLWTLLRSIEVRKIELK